MQLFYFNVSFYGALQRDAKAVHAMMQYVRTDVCTYVRTSRTYVHKVRTYICIDVGTPYEMSQGINGKPRCAISKKHALW